MSASEQNSSIVIYHSKDGQTKLDVCLQDETVWLTQAHMAELFEKSKKTISEHIINIFDEGELDRNMVVRKFRTTTKHGAIEGKTQSKDVQFYNLDMIISVGYRVKSLQGTQFRIWATQRIKEYIVKGFTLDDERLKQGGKKARYFQELLQRIRDIRSSERNFYQQVTDIYATSIDYKSNDVLTKNFFATVQNKMHFAVHGQTAAEMISTRANAAKPLMGLVNFKGDYITAYDAKIAKNYLSEHELHQLNLIVSLYLDFAELQATNGRLMKMADWISKLDDFLKLSEKELLTNAGNVSADAAAEKAEIEFEKYRIERSKNLISDFDSAVKELEEKQKSANFADL